MRVSLQRLGDNPRDHDAGFTGLSEEIRDVPCVRPDALESTWRPSASKNEAKLKPWNIYPPPPPPHWHWKEPEKPEAVARKLQTASNTEEFDFSKCEIPEEHDWQFSMDDKGVYQVYQPTDGQ